MDKRNKSFLIVPEIDHFKMISFGKKDTFFHYSSVDKAKQCY